MPVKQHRKSKTQNSRIVRNSRTTHTPTQAYHCHESFRVPFSSAHKRRIFLLSFFFFSPFRSTLLLLVLCVFCKNALCAMEAPAPSCAVLAKRRQLLLLGVRVKFCVNVCLCRARLFACTHTFCYQAVSQKIARCWVDFAEWFLWFRFESSGDIVGTEMVSGVSCGGITDD